MSVMMPKPSEAILARRRAIVEALRAIVPGEGVVDAANEMAVFESDGLTAYRQLPLVVVLPQTVDQVAAVLRYCHREEIPVVPRGSGTSLSGGALPLEDGVLLVLSKFNRVLEIDYDNRCAVVQPGVTNLGITHAVAGHGFYYAPDPSSQIACSIGGNVAENSGGVHCLKYGLTVHNILAMTVQTVAGEELTIGSLGLDSPGYDLMALFTDDAIWEGRGRRYGKTFGRHQGAEAIRAMFAKYTKPPAHFDTNVHFLTSELIDVQGTEACGGWVLLQTSTIRSGKSQLSSARLTVRFRCEDNDWRISHFQTESLFNRPVKTPWDQPADLPVPE